MQAQDAPVFISSIENYLSELLNRQRLPEREEAKEQVPEAIPE